MKGLRRIVVTLVLAGLCTVGSVASAGAPARSESSEGLSTGERAALVSGRLVVRPRTERRGSLRLFGGTSFQIVNVTADRVYGALEDPNWSALGQGSEAANLPLAVIADVDETLLDNSPFEGWMLRSGRQFNAADWTAWVDAAEALPLAGAVEFARYAAERGVTLFYVTNRDAEHEAATLENLRREGFPLRDDVDVLLLRGERPEWTSDKQGRRDLVAAGFRVVVLLGDDLNDFMTGVYDATPERRAELAATASDRFGTSWFVLPNPHYGSWKRALDSGQPRPSGPEEVRARKLERLRAFR